MGCERGQLAARLRARRSDPVPRGRRVPPRRPGSAWARWRLRSARTSSGSPSTGSRALASASASAFRTSRADRGGGQQARLPGARGPVRDPVRGHHEGGGHASRQRAARADDARARGARAPRGRRARGRGLQALLAVVCNHLGCSLALVDESGRVVASATRGTGSASRTRSSCRSSPRARWSP